MRFRAHGILRIILPGTPTSPSANVPLDLFMRFRAHGILGVILPGMPTSPSTKQKLFHPTKIYTKGF